jgi:hypothetical protein
VDRTFNTPSHSGKFFHILEERDGEYFDRVVCTSYEEAEEIIKEVGRNFIIVPASEVDDYLDTQNDDTDYEF